MKVFFTSVLALFLIIGTVHAFNPSFNTITEPFGVFSVTEDPEVRQEFYGTLADYPDTYEIVAKESFTLTIAIDAVRNEIDQTNFSGLVVRRTDVGRIEEVARLNKATWEQFTDETGLTYLAGARYEEPLAPGKYRVEVSTPENQGQYRLTIGHESPNIGYVKKLGSIRKTHEYLGYGPLKMFLVPAFYWPVMLITILLVSLIGYRFYRKRAPQELSGDTKFSE